MIQENKFWRVCEALDCLQRVKLLEHLLSIEKSEFPCVCELADFFHTSEPAISVHLRKLASAGLVSSKRATRRVYYRAFATTPEGETVIAALRDFFATNPSEDRMFDLVRYAHALSHERRHLIVRCLHAMPGLALKDLCRETDMPPPTADRLLNDLDKAHIVDLTSTVIPPPVSLQPESTLLALTLA